MAGIGVDIVEIDRIKQILQRTPRFEERVFTPKEREWASRRRDPFVTYAGFFAAREAVLKALGTGFGAGVGFQDVEVTHNDRGKPVALVVRKGAFSPYGLEKPADRFAIRREEALARLPGIGEGLERRIARAAAETVSREALIDQVKTRRYTRGRISRALCHALMHVSAEDLPALPGYARLLGFREGARPLLRRMQESGFPLYSRPARAADMALDIRADELWRIGAGLPRGEIYREAPVILP